MLPVPAVSVTIGGAFGVVFLIIGRVIQKMESAYGTMKQSLCRMESRLKTVEQILEKSTGTQIDKVELQQIFDREKREQPQK